MHGGRLPLKDHLFPLTNVVPGLYLPLPLVGSAYPLYHHYWGGLRRTRELAAVCEAFGLALSMHSNSHLGISLAAMTHVAAAIEEMIVVSLIGEQ